jgi:hypothetical protein
VYDVDINQMWVHIVEGVCYGRKKGPLDPWQPQQLANPKEIWSMKSFLASRRFKVQVGH